MALQWSDQCTLFLASLMPHLSWALFRGKTAPCRSSRPRLAEIFAHASKAAEICHELRFRDDADLVERVNPQSGLIAHISQLEDTLLVARDQQLPILLKHVTQAGAKKGIVFIKDIPRLVTKAFMQFSSRERKEILKRLVDCHDDPPAGTDMGDIATLEAWFKILDLVQRRELLKRLIDAQ